MVELGISENDVISRLAQVPRFLSYSTRHIVDRCYSALISSPGQFSPPNTVVIPNLPFPVLPPTDNNVAPVRKKSAFVQNPGHQAGEDRRGDISWEGGEYRVELYDVVGATCQVDDRGGVSKSPGGGGGGGGGRGVGLVYCQEEDRGFGRERQG